MKARYEAQLNFSKALTLAVCYCASMRYFEKKTLIKIFVG